MVYREREVSRSEDGSRLGLQCTDGILKCSVGQIPSLLWEWAIGSNMIRT